MFSDLYMSRSAAVRAARRACQKALDSDIYQAFEGPDYAIHPSTDSSAPIYTARGRLDIEGERFRYELRGPAKDAAEVKAR